MTLGETCLSTIILPTTPRYSSTTTAHAADAHHASLHRPHPSSSNSRLLCNYYEPITRYVLPPPRQAGRAVGLIRGRWLRPASAASARAAHGCYSPAGRPDAVPASRPACRPARMRCRPAFGAAPSPPRPAAAVGDGVDAAPPAAPPPRSRRSRPASRPAPPTASASRSCRAGAGPSPRMTPWLRLGDHAVVDRDPADFAPALHGFLDLALSPNVLLRELEHPSDPTPGSRPRQSSAFSCWPAFSQHSPEGSSDSWVISSMPPSCL